MTSTNAQPFDRTEAIARAGDDEELMLELLDLFLGQREELMGAVRTAVSAGDAKALEHSAHALKGSLLALAADQSSEIALSLERIGRAGNLEEAPFQLARLETAIAELSAIFSTELAA